MFCQISGHICAEPVVSKKNGLIFERKLVEAQIEMKGLCPITGLPLSKDDLIAVCSPENAAIAPRTAATTSAPALLRALQVEWDASMLEAHGLKKQNIQLQQELACSLYNYDAACRVVARLLKENTETREKMLKTIKAVHGNTNELKNDENLESDCLMENSHHNSVNENQELIELVNSELDQMHDNESKRLPARGENFGASTLPAKLSNLTLPYSGFTIKEEFKAKFYSVLKKTSELLSSTRKLRKTPETATAEFLAGIKLLSGYETPYMGISLVKVVQTESSVISHLVVVGKTRGVVVYEYPSLIQPQTSWPVKQKKVTQLDVLVHSKQNPILLIVRRESVSVVSAQNIIYSATMEDVVTSVAAHPSGEFFATLTSANAIHMHHVASRSILFRIANVPADVRSIQFHPDGMLLAAATSNAVHIFSAMRGESAAEINNHSAITLMSFSENGFHLATADITGHVHIWDLRKLLVTFTLNVPATPSAIKFDYSGNHLAVSHAINENCELSAVSIFSLQSRCWTLVGNGPMELGRIHPISDIAWGVNSKSIILVSSESSRIVVLG